MSESAHFTYQTRLDLAPLESEMLDAYAALYGQVERSLFASVCAGENADAIKPSFCRKFGITTRQYNAVSIGLKGKIESIKERRHQLIKEGAQRIANSIFVFAMNQAKYDSLPPDLKKVIDANSGSAVSADAGGRVFDGVVEPNRKLARDHGNKVAFMSDAEMQRWVKASENVDDDWVKEVSAKGVDGKKLLEEARALIKQYDE